MAGNVKEITDDSFQAEVGDAQEPVLVDFWAPWCGPCRSIAPIVEELAEEYAGKLKVAKLNVDENRDAPTKLGIRAIPTLIIFKGGSPAESITGLRSKDDLKKSIDKVLR